MDCEKLECLYGCGNLFSSSEIKNHQQNECPLKSDERIVSSEQVEAKDVPQNTELTKTEEGEKEEKSCNYCENCENYISRNNFLIHSSHCQRHLEICKICKKTVPRHEIGTHIHEMHSLASSENCQENMRKQELDNYKPKKIEEDKSCNYCENCQKDISMDNFSIHSAHCTRYLEICKTCKEVVPRYEIDTHICEMHSVVSSDNCQKSMQKQELDDFKASTISCAICEENFSMEQFPEHVLICSKKLIKCSKCEKELTFADLHLHQITFHSKDKELSASEKIKYYKLVIQDSLVQNDHSDVEKIKGDIEEPKQELNTNVSKESVSLYPVVPLREILHVDDELNVISKEPSKSSNPSDRKMGCVPKSVPFSDAKTRSSLRFSRKIRDISNNHKKLHTSNPNYSVQPSHVVSGTQETEDDWEYISKDMMDSTIFGVATGEYFQHVLPHTKKLMKCTTCNKKMTSVDFHLHQMQFHSEDTKLNENKSVQNRKISSKDSFLRNDKLDKMTNKDVVNEVKQELNGKLNDVIIDKYSSLPSNGTSHIKTIPSSTRKELLLGSGDVSSVIARPVHNTLSSNDAEKNTSNRSLPKIADTNNNTEKLPTADLNCSAQSSQIIAADHENVEAVKQDDSKTNFSERLRNSILKLFGLVRDRSNVAASLPSWNYSAQNIDQPELEDFLPCEFCDDILPPNLLILHMTAEHPEMTSFARYWEKCNDSSNETNKESEIKNVSINDSSQSETSFKQNNGSSCSHETAHGNCSDHLNLNVNKDRDYKQVPEVLLPCEFCEEAYPPDLLILHTTGKHPEMTSFAKRLNNDEPKVYSVESDDTDDGGMEI